MTNRERTRTLFVHSAASWCSALEGTPAYLFHRQRDSWWAHLDSNQGPTDYESAALTAELWARPVA